MKKFAEKLKNVFKNKKLCALIITSVLTLSTLGVGIGIFVGSLNSAGGGEPYVVQTPGGDEDVENGGNGDTEGKYTSEFNVTVTTIVRYGPNAGDYYEPVQVDNPAMYTDADSAMSFTVSWHDNNGNYATFASGGRTAYVTNGQTKVSTGDYLFSGIKYFNHSNTSIFNWKRYLEISGFKNHQSTQYGYFGVAKSNANDVARSTVSTSTSYYIYNSSSDYLTTLLSTAKSGASNWTKGTGYVTLRQIYKTTYQGDGISTTTGSQYAGIGFRTRATPLRTGYTFGGWSCFWGTFKASADVPDSNVDRDLTFTAIWTPHTYNITYDYNSGTAGTYNPSSAYFGSAVRISNPRRSGYTFGGWQAVSGLITGYAKYGETSTVSSMSSWSSTSTYPKVEYYANLTAVDGGTIKLQARWTKALFSTVSVTFDGNGGSPSSTTKNLTNGNAITSSNLPTATKTGYTLDGWVRKKNYLTQSTMVHLMNYFNELETSHGETQFIHKVNNVFDWEGASGGWYASSGFQYYSYYTGITLPAGKYRLSYYAYCPTATSGSGVQSTRLNLAGFSSQIDWVNSSSWKYYSVESTLSSRELMIELGYNYGNRSYFKDIELVRVDIDDFDNKNYLNDAELLKAVDAFHTQGDDIEYTDGTLFLNGNYTGSGVPFNLPKGKYRLSYSSRWKDFPGGTKWGSTFTVTGVVESYDSVKNQLLTNSKDWKEHSAVFTTTGDTIYLYFSQDYGGAETRNIRLERVDETVYEQLNVGDVLEEYYFDNVRYYAKWSKTQYKINVDVLVTAEFYPSPDVKLTIDSQVKTITGSGTVNFVLDYYTGGKYLKAEVTSDNHYTVSFSQIPNSITSPTTSAQYYCSATPTRNLTLYVVQYFTVEFKHGYEEGGTLPSTLNMRTDGEDVPLPKNNTTKKGYVADGWNFAQDGSSYNWTDTLSRSYFHGDTILYPDFEAENVKVDIVMVTQTGTGESTDMIAGSVKTTRFFDYNNQAQTTTETVTSSTLTTLTDYESSITVTPYEGFIFLGFNTTRTPPKPTSQPNYKYAFTPTTTNELTIYLFFKQVDTPLKWTSDEGGYWYFENGEFPQSEVTNSTTLSNLNNMSVSTPVLYTLAYIDGQYVDKKINEIYISIYENGGKRYACVEGSGNVKKWFNVEPIRWRVSDYGISESIPPSLWKNYGDTVSSVVAVSDKILFASAMTPEKIDDSNEVSSGTFWLNNYVHDEKGDTQKSPLLQAMEIKGKNEFSHSQDSFVSAGSQQVVSSGTYNSVVAVYSGSDTTLSNKKAKLTAFASYLLYGTTSYANTYDSYWSRDLQTGANNCQYGCGVVVTSYGKETLQWLNSMCGVRLTFCGTDVTRC